ncbi:MAG: adenylosuccinate synthase [Anaerolineae bacterium]|nr:adenylosuccinate synthase [Anaerolineae bacterium]
MPVTILVGAQWGDEGKGRVVDWLARDSDIVARYAGGDNAGHSVTLGETLYKLHLIPSGILNEGVVCILGHGMVINPKKLLDELKYLADRGIHVTPDRLLISERAHIITPAHIALDGASEDSLAGDSIGTTRRGIGPAYTDKVRRSGIQAHAMCDIEGFADQIHRQVAATNQVLEGIYHRTPLDAQTIAAEYVEYARQIQPFITNTVAYLHRALQNGQRILCEGAQGTLLDVDLGHYPFVTSSSPAAAGALTGLGFGPTVVNRVVGAAKSFSTRVGAGPMPTELHDELGDRLRGTGDKPWDEYGTTTGRPRRCGWLDIVALRYAVQVNGLTELVLTKLDVLSGFETLKIATAYQMGDRRMTDLPASLLDMELVTPVYETLPGWSKDIMNVRRWEDLPINARGYVKRIAELLGIPVTMISVGPERDQMVLL